MKPSVANPAKLLHHHISFSSPPHLHNLGVHDVALRAADPLLLLCLAGAFPPCFVSPLCPLSKWFTTTLETITLLFFFHTAPKPISSVTSLQDKKPSVRSACLACGNRNVLLYYVIVSQWLNQTSQRFVATRSGASIDEPRRIPQMRAQYG